MFHCTLLSTALPLFNESIKNEDIFVEGFSKEIFRSDHAGSDKVGGVCLYYEESLRVKRRKDLEIFQELIVTEISLGCKKIIFIVVYRSPNQKREEFDIFQEKLKGLIDCIKDTKPHCIIFTGNFNCRSNEWWPNDIDSTEGIILYELIESTNKYII